MLGVQSCPAQICALFTPLPPHTHAPVADHENNICTSADGRFYSFSGCNATSNNLNTTVYHTQNNTLFADAGATFEQECAKALDFSTWQALGQDAGSVTMPTPPISQLIALGAAKVLGGLEGP